MEGISVGRIVHYFAPSHKMEPRAAIIVRAWDDSGTVNLTVFQDWGNDGSLQHPAYWQTSVQHKSQISAERLANTENPPSYWDWPART